MTKLLLTFSLNIFSFVSVVIKFSDKGLIINYDRKIKTEEMRYLKT